MRERIDLVVTEQERRAGGIGLAVGVSFVLHGLFIAWFLLTYKPAPKAANDVPMTRYVELIKKNPGGFTEAPGKKVETAPLNAPLSNANRKAATRQPTGDKPTLRPGNDGGLFQPPLNPAPRGPRPSVSMPPQTAAPQARDTTSEPKQVVQIDADRLIYRQSTRASAISTGPVDLNKAIREVAKIASLGGGGDGLNIPALDGGEKGWAETGPLSFETTWFEWGEYAQRMVSKIRVNWYSIMPNDLLRVGVKGVVTIRFTIHSNGRISDITILETSGVRPYDFAARDAIEHSSPLNPLPEGFTKESERVTARFYYNTDVPER